MVASEGTLGIISKAILKLIPPPKASKAMMAVFDDVQKAADAVADIIAAHVLPCTLEFMDNVTINMVEDDVKIGLPRSAQAILLIEVDGHPAQVADDAVTVEQQLKKNGAAEIVVARDAEEKNKIWEARRKALPALARRPADNRPRRRHSAALENSRDDKNNKRHRKKIQSARWNVRTRGRRKSAPLDSLRQTRQGGIRKSRKGNRRTFHAHDRNGRNAVGRTRHRNGKGKVARKGDD